MLFSEETLFRDEFYRAVKAYSSVRRKGEATLIMIIIIVRISNIFFNSPLNITYLFVVSRLHL
ncbi:hypothetical protein M2387_003421 [Klebsiella sp. BIGb0407]|nr:hypothetical protein [Klebsiella sp. BIGb0407]